MEDTNPNWFIVQHIAAQQERQFKNAEAAEMANIMCNVLTGECHYTSVQSRKMDG